MLTSQICRARDFSADWYDNWITRMKQEKMMHRKQWEYVYIAQALFERRLLEEGKKGLGFAVGTEPLPALFASLGVKVLATDIDVEEGIKKGWTQGNQLCTGKDSLNQEGICDKDIFEKNVDYRPVDMRDIPDDLKDFDFSWSSCSFEHLGSIQNGLKFVSEQLKTLKVGGWGIHTSELNLTSNSDTMETEHLCLFRRRDYLEIKKKLEDLGHFVEEFDFSDDNLPEDNYVDLPPYRNLPHLKLKLGDYVSTSFGLIIQKRF